MNPLHGEFPVVQQIFLFQFKKNEIRDIGIKPRKSKFPFDFPAAARPFGKHADSTIQSRRILMDSDICQERFTVNRRSLSQGKPRIFIPAKPYLPAAFKSDPDLSPDSFNRPDYFHSGNSFRKAQRQRSRFARPNLPVRASLHPPLSEMIIRPVEPSQNAPSTQPYANP